MVKARGLKVDEKFLDFVAGGLEDGDTKYLLNSRAVFGRVLTLKGAVDIVRSNCDPSSSNLRKDEGFTRRNVYSYLQILFSDDYSSFSRSA
ncbi:MAG: hypothetical protein AABW73_01770 [Nanoarchaeota archaeon]